MVYGIDLGTTNSCIARFIARIADHDMIEIIRDGKHPDLYGTPSAIYYDENGKPVVGKDAIENLKIPDYAERVVRYVKRYVGEDFCPGSFQIGADTRYISPVEGSAIILHHLLNIAKEELAGRGEEQIVDAVITIPASFDNKQRECTKKAAELAGINVLGLLHEPTAAAISFTTREGETVLVFDLGGGTLDVSIVNCSRQNGRLCYETLGVSGDKEVYNRYIGGQDWDDEIVNYAVGEVGVNVADMSRHDLNALKDNAENCKKGLTGSNSANMLVQMKNIKISKTTFENITIDLVDMCVKVAKKAIEKAEQHLGIDGLNIDRFILVGGSSNMPMIKERLSQEFEERFGRGRSRDQWIVVSDPEFAIAKGAAKYAYALANGEVEGDNITIGQELSQFSYGTSVIGDDGKTYSLCNLVLSTDNMIVESRNNTFSTSKDGQVAVRVDIYENRSTEKSIPLDKSHTKIYDQSYKFDYPVPRETKVDFNVSRDKDGIISIRVSSPGHHEERHRVSTVRPLITEEVRNQIIQSIRLMDEP